MARIKIFEGASPDRNVGFTRNLDAPTQTDRAVQNLANKVSQEAFKYLEYQKKQSDVSSIARASAEKEIALQELRGQSLKEDGTYDVDFIQKSLAEMDKSYSKSLSSDAYVEFSQRETVRDGHEIARLQNENLKTTRENNRNSFLNSIEVRAKNSTNGSFEDMSISANSIRESILDGASSGIINEDEAFDLNNKTFDKIAKSFIDINTTITNYNMSEINDKFNKANLFIQSDPLGVFKNNTLLKAELESQVAEKRLSATDSVLRRQDQSQRQQERQTSNLQKRNYVEYRSKMLSAFNAGDQEKLAGYQKEVQELAANEGLTSYQASQIINTPVQQLKLNDERAFTNYLTTGDSIYINEINDPSIKAKAVKISENVPTDFQDALKFNKKYNTSGSTESLALEMRDFNKVFKNVISKNKQSNYTKEDLKAIYTVLPVLKNAILSTDSKIVEKSLMYQRSLRSINPEADRAFALQRLESLRDLLEQEVSSLDTKE
jgi:hypothetical protein